MGTVFKEVREEHGFSQKRLSRESGYDHSYISRIEAGSRHPSRGALSTLLFAMDLDTYPETYDRVMDAFGYTTEGHILPTSDLVRQVNELTEVSENFREDLYKFLLKGSRIDAAGRVYWERN